MRKSRVGNIKIVNFPAFSCSQNKIKKKIFYPISIHTLVHGRHSKKRFDVKKFSSNPS